MEIKVCKFGGTSMANAEAIFRVSDIIKSDETRKIVVVSAPGKRNNEDGKVTDMLLNAYHQLKTRAVSECLQPVFLRFEQIKNELGLDIDIASEFEEIVRAVEAGANKDYLVSRGEYLSAKILADLLGFEFVDAAKIVKFDDKGELDLDTTLALTKQELNGKRAVVSGFYGAKPNGEIKTFSRGGSDISGAIIASGVDAKIYENFTDVNGFMVCDPRIVKDAERIELLTYKELRELAYMGATVFHPDSIFPVRSATIPINIRNTFEPHDEGTLIVPTKHFLQGLYKRSKDCLITGIAGRKNFVSIHIEKSMLNSEIGFARRLLTVLENHNVSLEHLPTGIDTISLIIDGANFDKALLPIIIEDIKKAVLPDVVEVNEDLALIAIVGHGMTARAGVAGQIFEALRQANISVNMIDQGSSEINVIIGVSTADFEGAISQLYNHLIRN